MDLNKNKYYIADNNRLTEAEKLQMAKDLLELERQGVLEYRDDLWKLAAGVEIEETPNGQVAHFPNKNHAGIFAVLDVPSNDHHRAVAHANANAWKPMLLAEIVGLRDWSNAPRHRACCVAFDRHYLVPSSLAGQSIGRRRKRDFGSCKDTPGGSPAPTSSSAPTTNSAAK